MTQLNKPELVTTSEIFEGYEGRIVGSYTPRIDAYERVTGNAKYSGDWKVPDMLYGKIIQSTIPNGLVRRIDTTKAMEIKGVVGIITCFDDDTIWSNGERIHLRRVFTDRVRFVGDVIGAVAATSRKIAEEAVEAIQVEYEEFPSVFKIEEAMETDAPKLWEDGNILGPLRITIGDLESAFKKANATFERKYEHPRVHNAPLEPGVSLAWWDSDGKKLTVVASAQGISACREGIATDLKLPLENVRVICLYKGGGFGNKANSMNYDLMSSLLAMKTGRPVMVEYSREQDFVGVHGRWSSIQTLRAALDTKEKRVLGIDLHAYCDIGAYTRAVKMSKLVDGAESYYACDGWASEIYGVYTNSPATAHMRAPTGTHANFAAETFIDEIAHELEVDPWELRMRNYARKYHVDGRFVTNTMQECLEVGAEKFGWKNRWKRPRSIKNKTEQSSATVRGVGVAMANFHSYVGKGEAVVKLKKKGTLEVYVGVVDIGTGAKSVMAMIAADAMGISLDNTHVIWGDTDTCPYSVGESGSRTTGFTGMAVRVATQKLKQQVLSLAASRYGVGVQELDIQNGQIVRGVNTRTPRTIQVLVSVGELLESSGLQELTHHEVNEAKLPEHSGRYSFCAHFAEIEADLETGQVRVVDYLAAHESGEIINKLTSQSQVQGSVVMGIGMALSERLLIDPNYGNIQNPSFMLYKLPDHTMIPKIRVEFIESEKDPYGPKSIGEIPLVPVASVIGNAIFNATGARLRSIPFLPEKLLRELYD